MHHRAAVGRRNLHGRVPWAGRGPADQKRDRKALPLHFRGHMGHLFKAWSDQAREADHVHLMLFGGFQNLIALAHHADVDDVIVITAQNHTHDVLADIVYIALDGGHQDRATGRVFGPARGFFGLHFRHQVSDGLFHNTGRLDHLWKEHLAGPKAVADDIHGVHQRAFDDRQGRHVLGHGLVQIDVQIIAQTVDNSMCQTVFQYAVTPGFVADLFLAVSAFELVSEFDQAVRGIGATVEEDVFNLLQKVGRDILIDHQLGRVDDGHVQTGLNGVVEERRIHGFADGVVATERERNVGYPA